MANAIDINLTQQQLLALGNQLGKALGPLSPLIPKSDEQQAAAKDRVLSPSLIGADGRLLPELVPTFNTLADPKAYALVAYLGRAFLLETAYYYPDASTAQGSVSLTDTDDGLNLKSPGVKEGVYELLRQYIGETVLRHLDFEYTLPLIDAWVLFAILDACRRKMLDAVINYAYPPMVELSMSEVFDAISVKSNNMQWLSPYFAGCLTLARLSQSDTEVGIRNLQKEGLLRIHDDIIYPDNILARIADEFLVLDGHIRLRTGMLKGDQPEHVDMRAIQGRSGAIMFWSYDEQAIDLISFSPAQLMYVISSLIESPATHLSGPAPQQKPFEGTPPPPESLS